VFQDGGWQVDKILFKSMAYALRQCSGSWGESVSSSTLEMTELLPVVFETAPLSEILGAPQPVGEQHREAGQMIKLESERMSPNLTATGQLDCAMHPQSLESEQTANLVERFIRKCGVPVLSRHFLAIVKARATNHTLPLAACSNVAARWNEVRVSTRSDWWPWSAPCGSQPADRLPHETSCSLRWPEACIVAATVSVFTPG